MEDSCHEEGRALIEEAWTELQRSPYVQARLGTVASALPEISLEAAQRRSRVGNSLLARLERLGEADSPHDLALTLRLVRFHARLWAREADWYWTVVDPYGIGYFGLFTPTAYCGGYLLNAAKIQFASAIFAHSSDIDRYRELVLGYARLIDQFTDRTRGQAQRGIRLPKVQVTQARRLLSAYRADVRQMMGVSPERLSRIDSGGFSAELERLIGRYVEPAFERALTELSDEYGARAPDAVGVGQYPDGDEIYRELVKLHTTLDVTPEEVHAQGVERIAAIGLQVRAIQKELGFEDDRQGFLERIGQDARWRASTVQGVTAVFQRYIDRIKPHLPEFFSSLPQAPYNAAPLPEAQQGSMTFGYYDAPTRERGRGFYLFNAANLTTQPLYNVAALTYHELVPGHHLHFGTQQENSALHPFRKYSLLNAYNEGWAEYAASFAGEIGMYSEPQERYGRLIMDSLFTSRLVVDTGMNALGWSLDEARRYMREHSGLSEPEIVTESIRYSCDIPAQALAYKLGEIKFFSLRAHMREALGERFEMKHFHSAVLGPGALPLPDVAWHLEHEIHRLQSA